VRAVLSYNEAYELNFFTNSKDVSEGMKWSLRLRPILAVYEFGCSKHFLGMARNKQISASQL